MILLLKLMSYLPRPLPVGMADYEKLIDRVILLGGNYADRDSISFVMSSEIMHLGALQSSIPDRFFVRRLRKLAANQIAGQTMQNIKNKQIEAAQAQEAAKQQEAALAEVTPTTELAAQGDGQ